MKRSSLTPTNCRQGATLQQVPECPPVSLDTVETCSPDRSPPPSSFSSSACCSRRGYQSVGHCSELRGNSPRYTSSLLAWSSSCCTPSSLRPCCAPPSTATVPARRAWRC